VNLFVLPSWYPSAADPVAGGFVREQVAALAGLPAAPQLVVGTWGHHDGALSLRDPAATFAALRWRLRARAGWRQRTDGAVRWQEVETPRLSWTLAVARGGAAGLLRASRRNLAAARERLGRVDLVHAHVGFPAGWIASVLAAEAGVPYVLTEHMGPFPVPQLLDGDRPCAELRRAFENAAATIAVSPALAARIRSLGLPCSDVVPNAIDGRRFDALPAHPGPPGPPFVWLALSTLASAKGIDLLLDAFARWNPRAGEVELRIAGDGPQRGALRAQAQALGLGERVRFLGALRPEQVPGALLACHAFVLPSRHETFGVVLAEALASGRPVLSTRCGGPESIVGPHDGLLVPPGDVDALAAGLAELTGRAAGFDPAALCADALARFGRAAVARRLLAIYERVLAQ
jgi:glycosyltransferase involved in cell wall biosynthesis